VSLNLLGPGEAVDLLLRTGEVSDADVAASEAAAEIAELCGNLPLYLSICGGIILAYEGDVVWQTELIAMLLADRVGVIDDGSGDNTAQRLVDNSLSMIKDEAIVSVFLALGLCPEDVLVVLPVAVLIVCAAAEPRLAGKLNAVVMRRSIKALVDRHLLQGNVAGGVQMHDVVRDLVRSRLGGEDGIRTRQREVVRAFAAACPAGGWVADDAVGQYAALAVETHMAEAVLPKLVDDEDAQAWLQHSEGVIVSNLATALGSTRLEELSAAKEAAGDLVGAARVAFATRSVKGLPPAADCNFLFRAAELLEAADDPSCLEFETSVLHLGVFTNVMSARSVKCRKRWAVLLQAPGVTMTFKTKLSEYWNEFMKGYESLYVVAKLRPCPKVNFRAGHSRMLGCTIAIAGEASSLPGASSRERFFASLQYAARCFWSAAICDMDVWNPELCGGEAVLVDALAHWTRAVREPGEASMISNGCLDLQRTGQAAALLALHFGNIRPLFQSVEVGCALFQQRGFPETRQYKGSVIDVQHWREVAQALVQLGRPVEACAVLEAMGFVWSDDGFALYDAWFARGVSPGYVKEADAVHQRLLLFLASPQSAALDAEVGAWLQRGALTPAAIAQHERDQFDSQFCGHEGILQLAAAAFLKLGRDDEAAEAARILVSPEHECVLHYDVAHGHGVLGQVAAKRGEAEEADGHFRRALTAAVASRFPLFEVVAARDWQRAVPASAGVAGAAIDAACLKMGKARAELAPVL
jgi:hypothetical protein